MFTIHVDQENNAMDFYDRLNARDFHGSTEEQALFNVLLDVNDCLFAYNEVLINDDLWLKLSTFLAEHFPEYSDGPEYARYAWIIDDPDESEDKIFVQYK